jgi:hypothetical protein
VAQALGGSLPDCREGTLHFASATMSKAGLLNFISLYGVTCCPAINEVSVLLLRGAHRADVGLSAGAGIEGRPGSRGSSFLWEMSTTRHRRGLSTRPIRSSAACFLAVGDLTKCVKCYSDA